MSSRLFAITVLVFAISIEKCLNLNILNRSNAMENIFVYVSNRRLNRELEIRIDNIDKGSFDFDSTNLDVVIIHGWTESHSRPHYVHIRDEYLKKYDCNVFAFDYNRLDQKGYTYATEIAPDVGELIAETLQTFKNLLILDLSKVHVIAHSLGCHVAGFVGKNVFRLTKEKLNKITALDPAGPTYNGLPSDKRLDKTDAISVVVLHTDGLLFGSNEELGTLDIYFNPLRPLQPGCSVMELIKEGEKALCNHWISYKYFIKSINSPQYVAIECPSAWLYVLGFCASNRQVFYTEDVGPEIAGTFYVSAVSPLQKEFFSRNLS